MKHIFPQPGVYELDIADGLKQLLHEKKYDLNSLLQSNAESVSKELGIEEYVVKIIIEAANRKQKNSGRINRSTTISLFSQSYCQKLLVLVVRMLLWHRYHLIQVQSPLE